MKKIFLIASAALLCMPKLSLAQNLRGDQSLEASYGLMSGTDILGGYVTSRSRPNYDHGSYNEATSKTGNMFLTYRYSASNRLQLGITLGTEFVSFNNYSNPHDMPPVILGQYKANITTLAFEAKLLYYNGPLVQMYGLTGMGARYYSDKTIYTAPGQSPNFFPKAFFNSQWTPIGVKVGRDLAGYAEFGIGYKGLVNAGISYRVCRKSKPVNKPE